MDAETISPEERLKQINEERKVLKEQVTDERTQRLEKQAKMRERRDYFIESINGKLKRIQEVIFRYNKLGKVAKMEYNSLKEILEIINEIIPRLEDN